MGFTSVFLAAFLTRPQNQNLPDAKVHFIDTELNVQVKYPPSGLSHSYLTVPFALYFNVPSTPPSFCTISSYVIAFPL